MRKAKSVRCQDQDNHFILTPLPTPEDWSSGVSALKAGVHSGGSLFRALRQNGKTAAQRSVQLFSVLYPELSLCGSGFDDIGEIRSLQGSTADEGTVDIRLAEEFSSIGTLHGTAIEDTDRLGSFFAVH